MRPLFLTLLCSLNFVLLAQADYPFLTDGKRWVQDEFSSGGTSAVLIYIEFALGDTVEVDGITYTQLLGDSSAVLSDYQGLLRETDGRLLMLRNGGVDTLMDFNMQVGDTIITDGNYSEPQFSQHMVLLSIDSVEILDGSIRKRLNFELNNVYFDGSGFAVSWIDGIGSTRGTIFNSFCSTNSFVRSSPSCQSELICVKDAGSRVLYSSTEDEIFDCTKVDVVSSTPNHQLPTGTFKLYPNPASNITNVKGGPQHPIARVVLTNVTGQTLLDRTLDFPTSETIQIETTAYVRGLYNLTVFTPDGRWSVMRVVKR